MGSHYFGKGAIFRLDQTKDHGSVRGYKFSRFPQFLDAIRHFSGETFLLQRFILTSIQKNDSLNRYCTEQAKNNVTLLSE